MEDPFFMNSGENMEITNSSYITTADIGDVCPLFFKDFNLDGEISSANLEITALGVYEASLNGSRVGDFIMAPGWTAYNKRLQVQSYDVTTLIKKENRLCVTVGRGWFRSPMPGWEKMEGDKKRRYEQPCGLIAALTVSFADGRKQIIRTDESWQVKESPIRFSEIYDGEIYDGTFMADRSRPAENLIWSKDTLIPQEGEIVKEIEAIDACSIIRTPAGETVVDFGQEVTGYVRFTVNARCGDKVRFLHGEVLDKDGNFYNANYRSAKAEVQYICKDGEQTWNPRLTFFGFRYIKLESWPGIPRKEDFKAIVVHSELHRTAYVETGFEPLNKLVSNVFWGQRDNYLDVPTDCPQRDERMGWTGDAEVFTKAASYNYDILKFMTKWLHDLAADQRPDGEVGQVIPDIIPHGHSSAAWGDAAVICPWQLYQTYGDKSILQQQFKSMKAWVDYITNTTPTPGLWTDHFHFGDWLALDAPEGDRRGASRIDLVATAYYANSTELLAKTGELLGNDMEEYWKLHSRIKTEFRKVFPVYITQTEHVLALQFNLASEPEKTARDLAELVIKDGVQLRTGFTGTPYLLHVLSSYGYTDLAWKLLLRREYPSWLYSVDCGATTIWEHWDGIKQDGSFWSTSMNSFNHYAYGAVIDWIYEKAAGISHTDDHAGFTELLFQPHPCKEIGWLKVQFESRQGQILSYWKHEKDDTFTVMLETPVEAKVILPSGTRKVKAGKHTFIEQYK